MVILCYKSCNELPWLYYKINLSAYRPIFIVMKIFILSINQTILTRCDFTLATWK